MKNILIQACQVCKTFSGNGQETEVLKSVNTTVYKDDFTVIMGSSGAGKSTLLYALSGMDSITDGSVTFLGKEMHTLSEKKMSKLRAKEFGFIFQQTHLVSNLTLFENIAVAGYAAGIGTEKEIKEKAEALIIKMNIYNAKNRLPSQVSGGEAQRAAIARAVIGNPKLIFADEPTGALNKANSEEVLKLLTELNNDGQSIVMVTHDIRAALHGNRILYLEDGKILDELLLIHYGQDNLKEREGRVSRWLSSLQW